MKVFGDVTNIDDVTNIQPFGTLRFPPPNKAEITPLASILQYSDSIPIF